MNIPDREVLDGLHSFIERFVVPVEAKHEATLEDSRLLYGPDGSYSADTRELIREVRMRSAEAGYYTLFAPAEVGGAGLGPVTHYQAWESLYSAYGPGRILPYQAIAHWTSGPGFLLTLMNPEVRNAVGRDLMSGRIACCFAMSEPDAGSDAWAMSTRAHRDGDDWVLNGVKQWISNSPQAQYAITFAVTNDELRRQRKGGISCFLVPTDAPGFSIDSVLKLFGHVGGNESILSLTNVRVPAINMIGELGDGFRLALNGVALGRMYNAGRCVGLAMWALRRATEYAQQRTTFGKPIREYQGISFQLADSAIDIYAGRAMSLDCASQLEAGSRAVRDMAMVKAYTTEMCFRVYDRAMQVLGGMGLTNETKLYDGWHQARIVRIADGSGEIMRRTIAQRLFAGELDFH
jgi:acyl-CoA dehydrogenase